MKKIITALALIASAGAASATSLLTPQELENYYAGATYDVYMDGPWIGKFKVKTMTGRDQCRNFINSASVQAELEGKIRSKTYDDSYFWTYHAAREGDRTTYHMKHTSYGQHHTTWAAAECVLKY